MSISTDEARAAMFDRRKVFNVPNQLSTMRLILAIVLFWLIGQQHYLAGMYVFIVAAGTDWIDGFYARRYNQVTTVGRILDPFVDKIIICGTFIYLAAIKESALTPAMAVIVVGRELLVTALRSFFEQQGSDFSANLLGKLKMVLQCLAAAVSLFRLSYATGEPVPHWQEQLLIVSVWSAVVITVLSGVVYVVAAIRLVRR